MITVNEALDALFALVEPLRSETVPLTEAAGRTLARDVAATRAQPPFSSSAMDGYAISGDAAVGDVLAVIGEAAAGHAFDGAVKPGQAVRIFTGAPVPEGGTRVLIQENVTRDGDVITVTEPHGDGTHIRPKGGDFDVGHTLPAPRRLGPSDVALLASMNCAEVPVVRRPSIALIATGDELVMPGETPGPDQIIASNTFGLKAMFEAAGAQVRMIPIAKDTDSSLGMALELAKGADLIVTIGGASVGDHDIVGKVAADRGLERAFYKIAMRPGKPLMAGRIGDSVLIGLPGNPVSSMVCGEIFIRPVLDKMLGFDAQPRPRHRAKLMKPLPANGPREHYMRARHDAIHQQIQAFEKQDSSLLMVLAHATALIVRPPNDLARAAGDTVEYVIL
ncbi:gephyrin-like molybdotransferase Glp [uncultured Litoreibacter sp.]|uniref:molybdopterin molybdotransferase MoeA n=1 Tax=uncultured Litoreibacter sp. TaxID=1392394 RepID=UPI0026154C76|nr:gephyrin-like molybdotransferase Glp [uncultured Litoreibacter sp.]